MKRTLPATPFFSRNGVPTKPFVDLLELAGISDRSFDGILELTQKSWRKEGTTAAKIVEEDSHLADRALPLFRALSLVGAPKLSPGDRQWSVLLGATYVAMHKRFAYGVGLWKQNGIRWSNTAYLTSARARYVEPPKDSERDEVLLKSVEGGLPFAPGWQAPQSLPATENDLMPYILTQVGHHRTWNRDRERFVTHQSDKANTVDTLHAFIEQCDPRGDSCLVISSQPHVLRQGLTAARVLGDRFSRYDFGGYDTPEAVNVTKTLDDIAKLVYELHEMSK